MTVKTRFERGDFYQIPKELHKIVKSPYTFAVLCYMIQCTDDDGHCFPGQDTLAQGLMCRKQVRKAAAELENNGIVAITKIWKKGGGINLAYDVNFDKLIQLIKDSPPELQSNGLQVQQTDSPLDNKEVQGNVSPVQGNVSPVQGNVSPVQGNVSPNNETQLTKPILTKTNTLSNDKKPPTSTKVDREAARIAALLRELILTNNPKALLKENVVTNWGRTFDLMISKDKREPQDIEAVIRWCQADDFEKPNVLSADKVRSRFDNLYMKMNSKNNGHNKQPSTTSMYKYVSEKVADDN
jgi:Helix-turn-helix domain